MKLYYREYRIFTLNNKFSYFRNFELSIKYEKKFIKLKRRIIKELSLNCFNTLEISLLINYIYINNI